MNATSDPIGRDRDPDEEPPAFETIPELEEDQTIPPRPEEESADILRAIPDGEDHSRDHLVRPPDRVAPDADGDWWPMMLKRLADRVVVVVGASSGIVAPRAVDSIMVFLGPGLMAGDAPVPHPQGNLETSLATGEVR